LIIDVTLLCIPTQIAPNAKSTTCGRCYRSRIIVEAKFKLTHDTSVPATITSAVRGYAVTGELVPPDIVSCREFLQHCSAEKADAWLARPGAGEDVAPLEDE